MSHRENNFDCQNLLGTLSITAGIPKSNKTVILIIKMSCGINCCYDIEGLITNYLLPALD